MKAKKILLLSSLFALAGSGISLAAATSVSGNVAQAVRAAVVETEPAGELHLETAKIKGYADYHFETMTGHDGTTEVTAYVFEAGGDVAVNPEVRFVTAGTQTVTKPYTYDAYASAVNTIHFWYKLSNASEKGVVDRPAENYILQTLSSDGSYPIHQFRPVNDGAWHPWLMSIDAGQVSNFAGFIVKAGDINGSLTIANIEINPTDVVKMDDLFSGTSFNYVNTNYDAVSSVEFEFNFSQAVFSTNGYLNDHYSEFLDADGNIIDYLNGIVINGQTFGYWRSFTDETISLYSKPNLALTFPLNVGGNYGPVSIEVASNSKLAFKVNIEYFPATSLEVTFKASLFKGYNSSVSYELSRDMEFKATLSSTSAEMNQITFTETPAETAYDFQITNISVWDDQFVGSGRSKWYYFQTNVKRNKSLAGQTWWADHYRYLFRDILIDGHSIAWYNAYARANELDFVGTTQNPLYEQNHPTGGPARNYDTAILCSTVFDQDNYHFFIYVPYQLMIDLDMELPHTFSIREGAVWHGLDEDGNPVIYRNNAKCDYNMFNNDKTEVTVTDLSVVEYENGTGSLRLNTNVSMSALGYNLTDKANQAAMRRNFIVNGHTLEEWATNGVALGGIDAITTSEYNIPYFNASPAMNKPIITHGSGNGIDILVHPKLWAVMKTENITVSFSGFIAAWSDAGEYFRFTNESFSATTDDFHLNDLVNNCLHMSDYNENLGYCKDAEHGYYALAKAKFNGLTSTARTRFLNDAEYAGALNRLNAWAAINGDLVGSTGITAGAIRNIFATNSNDGTSNNTAIIVLSAAFGLTALAGVLFFKKKHN